MYRERLVKQVRRAGKCVVGPVRLPRSVRDMVAACTLVLASTLLQQYDFSFLLGYALWLLR